MEKTVDVPFTEKGRQIYAERTENFQKDDPNLRCLPSGLPRAGSTPYPLKIMQTPDEVVVFYDGGLHTFRIVPTDGRPHKPGPWTWYGDSVRLGGRYARRRGHRLQRQELARFLRLPARREAFLRSTTSFCGL